MKTKKNKLFNFLISLCHHTHLPLPPPPQSSKSIFNNPPPLIPLLDYVICERSLSINAEAIKSLSIEISNKKTSNLIFNAIYRPPTGDIKIFKQFCKDIFSKNQNMKQIFAGDFNINVLDCEYNRIV